MRDATVLIVTRKFDPHADQVIRSLNRREAAFFRLNTDDFHADSRVVADVTNGSVAISDRWGRALRFPDATRSVWYRKPIDPAPPELVRDATAREVIGQETREFLDCLGGLTEVPWINNPDANALARRKLPQLNLARALGLRVPATLVTNDPDAARAFHASVGGRLLNKSMKAIGFADGAAYRPIFSRKVAAAEFAAHAEQVALCPSLLQEYIDKAYELRITIIGEQVFCCRIELQSVDGAEVDWRRVDPFTVPHAIEPLPAAIEAALKAMLTRYNLRFGSFDMIVTPAGEYVFLELNPNGQWLWIELITGAALSEAMADLLAG